MAEANEGARIIARYERLKADRAVYESGWQDIAELIRPLRAEFVGRRQPGEKRYSKIFDSTPLVAADNFAGGIYGQMTNPANRWLGLKLPGDPELSEYGPVKQWLYNAATVILNSFGPEVSRFYNVIPMLYGDLACFGNGVFYSEEIPGSRRINDSVRALSECCFAENEYGDVDTVYRCFTLDARNAYSMFGDALSDRARKLAEKSPFEPVWFVHCVEPNGAYEEKKLWRENKPIKSVYVEKESRRLVGEAGYWEMPYHVARWSQAAGEVYGRGLGDIALPDVRTLNQQSRTALVAAQKAADPPLLAPDEGVIRAARTYPGGITYGAIDSAGRQLLQPLQTGADHRLTLEMMEQRRSSIREAFYFNLMQMVGTPDMTATEWLGRQEEKLRLMGPNLGRIQSEFLSPLVVRRFNMLFRMGQIAPAPLELQGQKVSVDYVSPLAKAQMAGEAQAVVRLYQSVIPIAQADPSVMDTIDNDEAVQVLAKGWAVPAPIMRGKEQVAELRAQRQQQQQMQMMLQGGQVAAKAFKDTASGGKDMATASKTQAEAGEKRGGGQQAPASGAGLVNAISALRTALRATG